jgi:hypothetical protein
MGGRDLIQQGSGSGSGSDSVVVLTGWELRDGSLWVLRRLVREIVRVLGGGGAGGGTFRPTNSSTNNGTVGRGWSRSTSAGGVGSGGEVRVDCGRVGISLESEEADVLRGMGFVVDLRSGGLVLGGL